MPDYVKVRVSDTERALLKNMIETHKATTMSGAIHALAFAGHRREDILQEYVTTVSLAYEAFKTVILSHNMTIANTEDQEDRLTLMESNLALMETNLTALLHASADFMQKARKVL